MLPKLGRRIKILYKGVIQLCYICYGEYQRKDFQSDGMSWIKYVKRFISENPELSPDFYGRYWDMANKPETMEGSDESGNQGPVAKDFDISESENEFNEMMRKMMDLGMSREIAGDFIKDRVTEFNKS